MATLSMNYAAAASVTVTINNKADDVWQASTVVDNTSDLYIDALVGGIIQAGTTPTDGQSFDFYAYGTYDGTNYTGGASGTDGVYTADGEEYTFPPLKFVRVDATTDQDYVWGPVSVAAAFGGKLPSKWGVVFHNNSGATTNATGTNNEVQFIGVKFDSA